MTNSVDVVVKGLPHFAQGVVVKGFGRGSKDLGCPTANFDQHIVDNLPNDVECGVYFGFASLQDDPTVYKMVMNIGWCPTYANTKKSMETHILHKFDDDFYGKNLKVAVLGYIRPELNFDSLDELIKTIKNDIKLGDQYLDQPEFAKYKTHEFLQSS